MKATLSWWRGKARTRSHGCWPGQRWQTHVLTVSRSTTRTSSRARTLARGGNERLIELWWALVVLGATVLIFLVIEILPK